MSESPRMMARSWPVVGALAAFGIALTAYGLRSSVVQGAFRSGDVLSTSPEWPEVSVQGAVMTGAAACRGSANGVRCGAARFCLEGACIENRCGDGITLAGEECDDGNRAVGDGCSASCRWEPVPRCGNGVVDPGEVCDDGNGVDDDGCTARCAAPRCGDAAEGPGEECDDGNLDDTDECTAACLLPAPEHGVATREGDGAEPSFLERLFGWGERETSGEQGALSALTQPPVSAPGTASGGATMASGTGGGRAASTGPSGNASSHTASSGDAECDACREQHCRTFSSEGDVFAGCFEAINPKFGAPARDAFFLTQCMDVVECARESGCAYDAARQGAGCYCGSMSVEECQEKGPAADAPCIKQWQAATRTDDHKLLLNRMTDTAFPAGWAYFLLECDRQLCQPVCTRPPGER